MYKMLRKYCNHHDLQQFTLVIQLYAFHEQTSLHFTNFTAHPNKGISENLKEGDNLGDLEVDGGKQ